jgi:uncharacterized membrane protein
MTKVFNDPLPKNRLEALTDGVYAVALTLLVLNLKIPAEQLGALQLHQALANQLPNLLIWLLSFWVILIYWESQVRLCRLTERIDTKILRLDFVHLGLISLLPFSTSLIGEQGDQGLAALIYTSNLWLISALFVIKTSYLANNAGLLASDVDSASVLRPARLMLGGMTLALLLSYVLPGWNMLALLAPKIWARNTPR